LVDFILTKIGPQEFDVNTFTTDGTLFTETTEAKTEVSRYTSDPERASVMKIRGTIIDLADVLTLAGGYYLDDSIDGKLEGGYYDYTVTPGVQYSFSMLYKIELGTLELILYDYSNTANIEVASLTSSVWSSYEVNITIPDSCTTLRVKLLQSNAVHSSPYYIDNVSLNGNVLLTNPDTYRRIPEKSGLLHQTLSGRRVFDLNSIHYDFHLGWHYFSESQYEALRKVYYENEMLFFDDGDVPSLTESETIYDSDLYKYTGITNPSSTHIANTDSSASLPSAKTDFQTSEYATGDYTEISTEDATYVETTNPTATYYLYHKFRVLSAIHYHDVQRFRVNVVASSNDSSAQNIDGCILYAWDGSNWVELTRTTNDGINDLTYTTVEPVIASKFVDTADNYVRLLLRSLNTRQGTSALILRAYYVEVEINEDLDEVIELSHRAILDSLGAVISVTNKTTGSVLALTTDYTVAADRRSITVIGQSAGDVISVVYNRYFETILTTLPEDWVHLASSDITRRVEITLRTLSQSK